MPRLGLISLIAVAMIVGSHLPLPPYEWAILDFAGFWQVRSSK